MQFFSQNILSKICAVAVIASPFIIVFGVLYQRSSGSPLGPSMFKAYSVLQDVPGASACDEEDGSMSAWVLNLTHLVRTQQFTFAAEALTSHFPRVGNIHQAYLTTRWTACLGM